MPHVFPLISQTNKDSCQYFHPNYLSETVYKLELYPLCRQPIIPNVSQKLDFRLRQSLGVEIFQRRAVLIQYSPL